MFLLYIKCYMIVKYLKLQQYRIKIMVWFICFLQKQHRFEGVAQKIAKTDCIERSSSSIQSYVACQSHILTEHFNP